MIDWLLPTLLLASGELVLAACALRVAVWAWRGFRVVEHDAPDPDGPGGHPIPITRARCARRTRCAGPFRAAA